MAFKDTVMATLSLLFKKEVNKRKEEEEEELLSFKFPYNYNFPTLCPVWIPGKGNLVSFPMTPVSIMHCKNSYNAL